MIWQRQVIFLLHKFDTGKYKLEYIESEIDRPILFESHCHAQFEMIAVLEGSVSIMLEGKSYGLSAGQTVIISPLLYHSVTAKDIGSYKRITALFDRTAIPKPLQPSLSDRNTHISVFSSRDAEELKDICQKSDGAFFAPLAESLMVRMLYETHMKPRRPSGSEADEFLRLAVAYIDEHLEEKILLEELAKHTMRSCSSFCHLFEEKMKVSPKQYILQKKLAYANKLIGEGVPPTVAAIRIGYENYSSFYRIYLKHFGISPSEK